MTGGLGTHDVRRRLGAARAVRRLFVFAAVALAAAIGAVSGANSTGPFYTSGQRAAAQPTIAPPSTPTSQAPTTTAAPTTTTGPDPVFGNGETIILAFAGDTNFEGTTARQLAADPASVFEPVAELLRRADLAMVNMETAIGTSGTPVDKEFVFQAPPEALEAYRAAGIDVVSAANNHGLDFGVESLDQTLAAARDLDFPVIGIGLDEDDAYAPFETEIRGQRIAVIAATQVLDGDLIGSWTAGPDQPGVASAKRVERLLAEVAGARARADTVVVFLHWGVEGQECPTGDQQDLAGELAGAGADVIVGAHAHRVQGGGMRGDAVVHYGLGNFSFFGDTEQNRRSGVFLVKITGRHVESYRWVPARIVDRQPHLLEGADRDAAVAVWESERNCTDLEA